MSNTGVLTTSFPQAVSTKFIQVVLKEILNPLHKFSQAGFRCVDWRGEKPYCNLMLTELVVAAQKQKNI